MPGPVIDSFIKFSRVTRTAERLKVGYVTSSTLRDGNDVIDT